MIHSSPFKDLDIPKVRKVSKKQKTLLTRGIKVNVLSYLFPPGQAVSDDPVWIDASDSKKAVSPKQMLTWVKRLMIGLDKLGLKRGDVCLIHSPNNVMVPAAYLGIVGGTRCFSAINPIYTIDEIVHQIKLTEAKCILAHPDMIDRDVEAVKKSGVKVQIFQFNDDERPLPDRNGIKDWRHMIGSEEEAKDYKWPELSAEESTKTVATINFSSGTTGMPKGVMIAHHGLISNVEQTAAVRWHNLDYKNGEKPEEERWLGFLPLYHAYGQMYACLMSVKFNVPIWIMRQFVYDDYCKAIQDHKITDLQVAPPVLIMMAKRPETKKYNLQSIKTILCGGAPLGKELQNEIAKKFNCVVKQGWGMTEVTCGSVIQVESRDDGTVGQLIPNNKLKLVDDDGKEVGFDTPGEMVIQAPNVMLGYWKNEAATRDTLTKDGWLLTGDVAVINKEGFIWIVDRKKEVRRSDFCSCQLILTRSSSSKSMLCKSRLRSWKQNCWRTQTSRTQQQLESHLKIRSTLERMSCCQTRRRRTRSRRSKYKIGSNPGWPSTRLWLAVFHSSTKW